MIRTRPPASLLARNELVAGADGAAWRHVRSTCSTGDDCGPIHLLPRDRRDVINIRDNSSYRWRLSRNVSREQLLLRRVHAIATERTRA